MKRQNTWETAAWHALVEHTIQGSLPHALPGGCHIPSHSVQSGTWKQWLPAVLSIPWRGEAAICWKQEVKAKIGFPQSEQKWNKPILMKIMLQSWQTPHLHPACLPCHMMFPVQGSSTILAKFFLLLLLKQLSKEPPNQYQAFPALEPSNTNPSYLISKIVSKQSTDLSHPKLSPFHSSKPCQPTSPTKPWTHHPSISQSLFPPELFNTSLPSVLELHADGCFDRERLLHRRKWPIPVLSLLPPQKSLRIYTEIVSILTLGECSVVGLTLNKVPWALGHLGPRNTHWLLRE